MSLLNQERVQHNLDMILDILIREGLIGIQLVKGDMEAGLLFSTPNTDIELWPWDDGRGTYGCRFVIRDILNRKEKQ